MSAEPNRTLQHLVSNGYQKNFADRGAVSVLDARTGRLIDSRRSTKTNWRVPDFLSVIDEDGEPDDALEREFANDERVILNRVRDIRAFGTVTKEQKRAVDILTAIHLVRSQSFKKRHGEVVDNWLANDSVQIAENPELRERFVASQGREPISGELEKMVAEQASAYGRDPNLHPDGVRYGATRLGELFGRWRFQLIEIEESLPGLVLADHPILHGRIDLGVLGFGAGAVGESDTVLVPISRRLAASYAPTRLPDRTIRTKKGLDWVNSLLIRGAGTEVACHPDDALATARLIRGLDRYPLDRFRRAALR